MGKELDSGLFQCRYLLGTIEAYIEKFIGRFIYMSKMIHLHGNEENRNNLLNEGGGE